MSALGDSDGAEAGAGEGRGGAVSEAIRRALAEMRLPKEAMAYLLGQTERTRRELFRVITAELKALIKDGDVQRELRRALLGMSLHVHAEVRFAADGGPKAKVATRLSRQKAAPKR